MPRKLSNKGFSVVEVVVVLVIVAVLALGGFFVWKKSKDDDSTKKTSTNTSQNDKQKQDDKNDEQPSDQYEGWKSHSNATYGISLRYPVDWKVDEGPFDSPSSETKQEYAINLKRNEDVKYNNTASIEVLGTSLEAAATWYDGYFAQSSSNNVSRTTETLKGRQSVQYVVSNSGVTTKLYLLAVGGKTVAFSSINEELNLQADPDYWTKFDKVFTSMEIK